MQKSKKLFLIFLSLLTVFSFVLTFFAWEEKSEQAESVFLSKTKIFVSGIDKDIVRELRPEKEDEESESHLFIKSKLSGFLDINRDARFAYFYIKEDSNLYFLVDGEPVISDDYSYPGQLYEEAQEEYYLPFSQKESIVTDPSTDRWGTWISILVPVIDQETEEVIAVLGVDFDAWAWRLNILSSTSPIIISLLIVLAICYAFFFTIYRKPKESLKSVRWRVLPIVALLIFLIIFIGVFIFWEQEERHKDIVFENSVENVQRKYNEFLDQQSEMIRALISSVENKEGIVENIKDRDKDKLLADWEDVFLNNFKESDITHFYFFDEERVCFLRVHNPEKSGDVINRETTLRAKETKETAHGIEIGPLGTFTMRVVSPVIEEEEIVGYIEIGKEIEDVLETLHRGHFQEIFLILNKDYLERDVWERGMEMLGREHDWELLENNAFIYSSTETYLEEFLTWIDFDESEYDGLSREEKFSSGDKNWMVSAIPVTDFSEKEVGKLIIIRDTYVEDTLFYEIISIAVLLGVAVLAISLIIVYAILSATDKDILEQEKEMRISIIRHDQLAKQSRTFNWEVDKHARYTYVSDNVKDIIGYSVQEIVGRKTVFNLHPKKGVEKFRESVLETLEKKEEMYNLENPIEHKKGGVVWVLSSGLPVLDKKGNLVGYRGADTDITNKKEIEESLKEREEQFELAVKGSHDGIWDWNLKTNKLYLSPRWKALVGYNDDELENDFSTFENLLHPKDKERVLAHAKKYIEGKTIKYEIEFRMLHKEGGYRWILAKGAAVYDDKGVPYRMAGSHSDISARKEMEMDIIKEKRELEKFRLAVEHASDHIVITDENGTCLYMNSAAENITGFKKEEIIGMKVGTTENWGGLMNKEDYEALWKHIKTDKKPFIGELKNKRKSGEGYEAKASIAPILNNKEEVVFFVGIERDITKEKQVDQAKTEFVSLASHQLRTPLSTINWYTEMLLDGDAGEINEEQQKYLEEIYNGNQRMVELVNALLSVSRLELGTFVVEPEDVDVLALASSVIKELRPEINRKNQLFEEFYQAGVSKIKADPKLMRIVFQNLLSNAVKYTPEKGNIKLDIFIRENGKEVDSRKITQDSLVITVTDDGYGIPYSQQEKIFGKLFRADNILSRDTEGTGLGLYIVKAIVDHSEGIVWFNSLEDEGTTFYVVLPLEGMKEKKGSKSIN